MKNHHVDPADLFGATGVTQTIERALASAGLRRTGLTRHVTDTIEDALSAAGLMPRRVPAGRGAVYEGSAREVDAPDRPPPASLDTPSPPIARSTTPARESRSGCFLERSFTASTGARKYKVYVPAGHAAELEALLPMIVMLHGCTQSPDDFAAGTRMNALADEHRFIVVYPAQCASANPQKCWNWFRADDQLRESGEPAIIAGITMDVAAQYGVDPRRIFVAGMSAGAAMAVILATTYPDLYAGLGAHSGLAYRAAHDVPSALTAMHTAGGRAPRASVAAIPVRTIVFHGDGDRTVHAGNADAIVRHAIAGHADAPLRAEPGSGTTAGGRKFSRTVYLDARGTPVAEQWIVHGAGHAWSGGSAAGTFTDQRGPDASSEMVRFFLSSPRAGSS